MNMKVNIVAFILARGGSKGIPDKNFVQLAGRPLIAHTINHAVSSELIDRVIVSTDHEGLALSANRYGAETPFMRPSELAQDNSTMIDGLKHAVSWLQKHEDYRTDIVVLLKATIPFREDGIIDRVIERLLVKPELDTVFAGYPTIKKYWRKQNNRWEQLASDIDPGLNRQDREPLYQEDHGVCCATKSGVVMNTDHYVGECVDIVEYQDKRSLLDIDDLYDYCLAGQVVKEWNPVRGFSKQMLEEHFLYGGLD